VAEGKCFSLKDLGVGWEQSIGQTHRLGSEMTEVNCAKSR
jgi:hypothetical protein